MVAHDCCGEKKGWLFIVGALAPARHPTGPLGLERP